MLLIRMSCSILLLCWANSLAAQQLDVVVQSGHASVVERIAFTSDGRILASIDHDGVIKIWDLRTFKEISSIHTGLNETAISPNALAFSVDDKSLIVLAEDRSIRIYEVASGLKLAQWEKTGTLINLSGAALNATRMLAAQLGETGEIEVRSVKTGAHLYAFSFPSSPETLDFPDVQNFTFSQNGDLLAVTATGGKIALVNTDTGKSTKIIKSNEPSCLTFKPGGGAIAVCEKDPQSGVTSIMLRSIPTGAVTKKLAVTSGEIRSLVWSPDLTTLVATVKTKNETSGEEDHSIRTWELSKNVPPRELKIGDASIFGEITEARFGLEGDTLAVGVADRSGGSIHLVDVALGRELTQLKRQSSYIERIEYLTNGQFLVDSDHLRVFDLTSIRQLSDQVVVEHAISASGKRMAAYNTLLRTFEIVDLETKRQLAKLNWDRFNITDFEVAYSPDDRFILVYGSWIFTPKPDNRLMLFDAASGELCFSFPDNSRLIAFKPDGKLLAYAIPIAAKEQQSVIKVWDVEERSQVQSIKVNGTLSALAFDPVRDHLSVASFTTAGVMNHYSLQHFRVSDGQEIRRIPDPGLIDNVAFSPDGAFLVSQSSEKIRVWNADGKELNVLDGHRSLLRSLSFSPDSNTLATASLDGEVIFWDYKKGLLIARLIVVGESDFIFVTPDNYYFPSRRGAAAAIAFRHRSQSFPPEQFDIHFNRPDLVLKKLGSGDVGLIQVYEKAHRQRLEQYGLREVSLKRELNLPEVTIDIKGIPRITSKKSLSFNVRATDSNASLARVNVYVNDVPIYGSKGLNVAESGRRDLVRQINLELSPGNNRIQVSVTNTEGVESLRQTFGLIYEGAAPQPELYVLAIGVTEYANEKLNLKYPARDAESVIKLFEGRAAQRETAFVIQPPNSREVERPKSFYKVHRLKLINEEAKIENILAARKFLASAKTDDQVVVFISGHGLLDEHDNYFFATHDIDLQHPASRGLSYQALESLLDGLVARRKLLLIDTCHAGEVAKGEVEKLQITETVKSGDGSIRTFAVTPKDLTLKPVQRGFQTSLALVEELFADLRLGNGISVVSASGGLEYAFESEQWSGGVFAYALRLGLGEMQADTTRDGKISSSELRDFVRNKVSELTQGKQKPTHRRESVEFDDRIF